MKELIILFLRFQGKMSCLVVDVSCNCKSDHKSGKFTICGNCIRNYQIAEKYGFYYDPRNNSRFTRRIIEQNKVVEKDEIVDCSKCQVV